MLLSRFMLMISLSFVFIQVSEATEQKNTAARDKILHRENEAVEGMVLKKLLMILLLKEMDRIIGSI